MGRHPVLGRESTIQARTLFRDALEAEGLLAEVEERLVRPDALLAVDVDDERVPVLLAVRDNGAAMSSHSTQEFMALCSIAQHFGRPGVPTDQAHIETLWGHVKRRVATPGHHHRPGGAGRRA